MILDKEIDVCCNPKNISYLKEKGYITIYGTKIKIKIEHLSPGSSSLINICCDICKLEKQVKYSEYFINTKELTELYYCNKCKGIKISGDKNVMNNLNIKQKHNDSINKIDNKEEILNKRIKTNKEKYGVEYPLQNKDVLNKVKETNLLNIGTEYVFHTKENREKCNINSHNKEANNKRQDTKKEISKKLLINKGYNVVNIHNKFIYELKCKNEHNYKTTAQTILNREKMNSIQCTICHPINSLISGGELQLLNFIKENYNGIILIQDKTILKGKHLDIYLPELKIAFEYNGLYWHSELYKDKQYHLNKTKLCEEQGILLIHIWEDLWLYDKEKTKSFILNKLGIYDKRIYARKCKVVLLDNNTCKNFVNANHLQNHINSKYKYGLIYNDELVSVMTFGQLRHSLGYTIKDETAYELLRFCSKTGYNIIGGASKLLSHFVKDIKPNKIISYADRSRSNGNLYKQLGFIELESTDISYSYIIDGIRRHRYNYRKDVLVNEGYDKTMSAHGIMLSRDLYRIYDCGNKKYILYF